MQTIYYLEFESWHKELIDLAFKGEVADLISLDREDYREAFEDGFSPVGYLDCLLEGAYKQRARR